MKSLHVSKQTNGGVLPQLRPLETVSADNPGVGPKRDTVDGRKARNAGVQHERGESAGGSPAPGTVTANPASSGSHVPRRKTHITTRVLVPVIGRDGAPLMPTHPGRARQLLKQHRAVVVSAVPFVIRLKDKTTTDGSAGVQVVEIGIDPGSKHTGVTVFTSTTDLDPATGEVATARRGLFAIQIDHRGKQISDNLTSRAQLRHGRRGRNLRHRQPRFSNRSRTRGWLAPSLQHRVDGTVLIMAKLRRWFPVTAVHQELVRFDMQLIGNPEISGVEYQQGTLFATEIREYLLEKYHHTCVYCDAKNTILNIDHVRPATKGGTNAVTNLVLACIPCNQAKGATQVEDFVTDPKRRARILASTRRPLRDAAAVNSTRRALKLALEATGLPVYTGTGGQTKFNRTRLGLPKTHCVDALVVGDVDTVRGSVAPERVMKQVGRGKYARTASDKYGFPRLRMTRVKRHYGFATGDIARAVVPTGKKAGTHFGRVAVRASGKFNITTSAGIVTSINHRRFTLVQRGNGWTHTEIRTER